MVKIGDCIIVENGDGGNVTNIIRLNDGRHIISFAPINGNTTVFLEGDYVFTIIERNGMDYNRYIGKI